VTGYAPPPGNGVRAGRRPPGNKLSILEHRRPPRLTACRPGPCAHRRLLAPGCGTPIPPLQLPYMDAAFAETMRLYPAATTGTRYVDKEGESPAAPGNTRCHQLAVWTSHQGDSPFPSRALPGCGGVSDAGTRSREHLPINPCSAPARRHARPCPASSCWSPVAPARCALPGIPGCEPRCAPAGGLTLPTGLHAPQGTIILLGLGAVARDPDFWWVLITEL
jgi:hypothetical protein